MDTDSHHSRTGLFERKIMLIQKSYTLRVVIILLIAGILGNVCQFPTAAAGQVTFTPVADAYVNANKPGSNFGSATTLQVDGSPVMNTYLRFNVSGSGGQPVTQAQLSVYAGSASSKGLVVKSVTDNSWGELTIIKNNAPGMGSSLATSPAIKRGTWVTLNVTGYVTGDGTYSFGITTTSSSVISISARESGANAPKLILTYGAASTPTKTSTKTASPTTVPTATHTPTQIGSLTYVPTATHTPTKTATPTVVPTTTSTSTSTATPTAFPTVTSTPTSTATPTTFPTATHTSTGTSSPTAVIPTATNTPVFSCSPVTLTKGPTLIYTGDNTRMRIFWQWSSNAVFQMQWGTDTSYSLGTAAVSPTDTANYLYNYDITGLNPGTKYYYRNLVGTQCTTGSFYAGPDSTATNIKFISYGDTRTNGSIHNGLAGQVVSLFQSDPAFQSFDLNVGDWVSADTETAWTGEWFSSNYTNIRTQDANLSEIGVRGNHEGAAAFWKKYWPEPFQAGGLYWSFDYGPTHIAMLDQYTPYGAGSAQYNWLAADLAASNKTWKFVVLHEPGWSSGGGHANNTTVQNDLQPLFVQYGVSIVFGGHNHYYARASVNGVTHLTMGGGGAPLHTPAAGQPNIVTAVSAYSYGQFTINGNTLTAMVVNNSGGNIDTFTITK
jgi:hypothetical protein